MKGFSDEKREYLRQELLDSGRELFARYGLKKTTMTELTEPVDIAPSTTYQFFDSKDELYLAVLERESEQFYERAVATLEAESDPERAIGEYLRVLFEELETNPLMEQLLAGDELDRLASLYSEEEFVEQRARELGYLVPYIRAWQADGLVRDGNPEVLAGAIDSTAVLAFHEHDIGEDLYPEIRDMMITMVASGLTITASSLEN